MFDVVKSPWMLSPECIVASEFAIFSTNCSKTAKKKSLSPFVKMTLTWVIKRAELVKECFDCHGFVAEVLHVNFSCALVDKVDSRCRHAHSTYTVHAFNLLQDPWLRQFFIKGWHAVLLDKAFFDDTSLSKKLAQENPALSTLLNQSWVLHYHLMLLIEKNFLHFIFNMI